MAAPSILDVFGAGFGPAVLPVRILALGAILNASVGANGILLMMTGRERTAAVGFGIGALVNIGLNLVLIPPYGAVGASWATVGSLVTWNGILLWWSVRDLRLDPTVFGRRLGSE